MTQATCVFEPLQAIDCTNKRAYLDLDLVESLAVVHTNDAANHLGDDDHVAKVSLDDLRLLLQPSSREPIVEAELQAALEPT